MKKDLDALAKKVDELKRLDSHDYELWKFFEERASRFGEHLWSVGIWLMTVLAAALAIPFVAKFIEPTSTSFPKITSPIPVLAVGLFGMMICWFAYTALCDLMEHIETNWARAARIVQPHSADQGVQPHSADQGERKTHGFKILFAIGIMAFSAFALMFVLAAWRVVAP